MENEIVKWVKIVVSRTMREKNITHLDAESLMSAGLLGYSQCRKRFDPNRGVKFKTYAEYRIKGAVLDEVRKMIGDERCKHPRPTRVPNFDFSLVGDGGRQTEQLESGLDIKRFFNDLPLETKDMEVLRCRAEGLNLREIGLKFGFSESRASQILAGIRRQIYPHFRRYMGDESELVTRECPQCRQPNDVPDWALKFDCDKCMLEVNC